MVHNNVDEPHKHYEEWKKLHMKEYILYDSVYMSDWTTTYEIQFNLLSCIFVC